MQMVIFIVRAQLVKYAGEGILHLFERLLLGGKAQVVGVDENVGGNWKWLFVHVEQHRGYHLALWKAISLVSPSTMLTI